MKYNHLNINERIVIAQLKKSGISINEIARHLGRSASTISREIKRNSFKTGNNSAQNKYEKRRENCVRKPILEEQVLKIDLF